MCIINNGCRNGQIGRFLGCLRHSHKHLTALPTIHLINLINLIVLSLSGSFCTGEPVLSQLTNTRMEMVLKGTYESNDPHPWQEVYENDYVAGLGLGLPAVSPSDFRLYMDIAQIGLTNANKQASETQDNEWSFFFQERTLFCPVEQAADGSDLKSCIQQRGRENHRQLFEEGVSLRGSDVASGKYKALAIYFRRMVTSPAGAYTSANVAIDQSRNMPLFDNKDVEGRDINLYYEYSLTDDESEQDSRISPYLVRDLDINIDSGKYPYVLETRIFLKNLFMRHVIVDSTSNRLVLIGPSDWLSDHAYNDTSRPSFPSENTQRVSNQSRLGGTILMTARTYFPHNAGSLQFVAGPACTGTSTGLSYIAVLPSGETFERSRLPLAATRLTNNAEITNLPPGDYDVYKTYDRLWRTSAGEVAGRDGFPESFRMCSGDVTVTASMATSIDISGCLCP